MAIKLEEKDGGKTLEVSLSGKLAKEYVGESGRGNDDSPPSSASVITDKPNQIS